MTGAAALGAREVLRIPAFRTLWLAQLISNAGDGLTMTALLLLVNALTGSTAALATMAIALAVPPLTIGLLAGAYADRWNRRRIMLASDLLRAILVPGFILVGSVDGLWLLYLIAFAQASAGTFFDPAKGAILPHVVPEEGLMAANSVSHATRMIAGVAGTAVAGVIIGLGGAYWPAFVLDGLSFVASFLLVLRLPDALGTIERGPHAAADGSVFGALADGLRIVARSRVIWVTLVTLSVAMLGLGAVNVLFVPLLINVLGASAAWFGPLEAAQTTSMVLAAGLVPLLARRLAATSIVTIAAVAVGGICAALSLVASPWHMLGLVFLVGWAVTPLQAAVSTLLQSRSTDATRGRVMSVLNASISATSVVSMAAAGLLADVIGIREVLVVAGAVCATSGILAFVLYPRGHASRGEAHSELAEATP